MRTTAALMLAMLAGAAPAWGEVDTLRMLLGSPDLAGDAAMVQRLDPEGARLQAIVADRHETRYVRMRAASWLALYDRVEVRARLAAVIEAQDDDLEVRAQALNALGLIEGAPALVRALARPERLLRETAVIGLGRVATPEARAALTAHRGREVEPAIRARIDMSLP